MYYLHKLEFFLNFYSMHFWQYLQILRVLNVLIKLVQIILMYEEMCKKEIKIKTCHGRKFSNVYFSRYILISK